MAEENIPVLEKNKTIIIILVSIPIITVAILGLWSLNANYILLVRDLSIDHIKRYHPETIDLLIHLTWSGGKDETGGIIGNEHYIYTSNGWIIEITYPVVSNPEYEIKADYSSIRAEIVGVPTRIIWLGRCINDKITENNYTMAQ
ncbi:hypothetical protein KAI60_02355 [Candidatus Bathyarchaeota archaeon]|nr:hypothetical protein [Candidatus Bathyarchaeota archaeon]